jgi:hypothetical protein
MKHLDKHQILTDYQHGLGASRSCESQLHITINDIAKLMPEKGLIMVQGVVLRLFSIVELKFDQVLWLYEGLNSTGASPRLLGVRLA